MNKQFSKRVRKARRKTIGKNTKLENYWFKRFTSLHDRLDIEMNRYIEEAGVHEQMTKGNVILIQIGPPERNYRPITCLPMMWKIQRAQIKVEIYCSLISHGLVLEEQKGCCKWTRDT